MQCTALCVWLLCCSLRFSRSVLVAGCQRLLPSYGRVVLQYVVVCICGWVLSCFYLIAAVNGPAQVLKQRGGELPGAQGCLAGSLGLNSFLLGLAVLSPILLAASAWLAPQLGTMTWCLLHPQGEPRLSVRIGWGGVSQRGIPFTRCEHVRLCRDFLPGVADSVSPAER